MLIVRRVGCHNMVAWYRIGWYHLPPSAPQMKLKDMRVLRPGRAEALLLIEVTARLPNIEDRRCSLSRGHLLQSVAMQRT